MKFNQIFTLMQQSFPREEFRDYSGQKSLLQNSNYHITTKLNQDNKIIAFMSTWNFPTFVFVEHFAVDQSMRGHGIGSTMLKEFLAQTSKNIILEVEPAHDAISTKRIKFYERFGFLLNEYNYIQPPLRKDSQYIELKIMSYPKKLYFNDFQKIKNILYSEIYSKN